MSDKKKNVRRIAVIGGNNAGKTVFITSLIDNLQKYDPEILKLGDDWRVIDAKIMNDESVDGLERFPQENYRSALADGATWPAKTFAASIACLNVKLKRTTRKWYRKDVIVRKLEIVDIAGERAADFGMVNCNYRQWSSMITHQLAAEGIDWPDKVNKEVIQKGADCEKEILKAYRDVLAELYKSGANASITPSTARITVAGQGLGGKPDDYAKALENNPVGLEGNEFVPLHEAIFKDEKFRPLIEKFEKAYEEYKKKIVEPIWSWLKHADDVVYLVDILGILADGMSAYNAEQALAKSCFSAICNKWPTEDSAWKKGLEWIKAKKSGLHFKRLIVVATKADLAAKDSRDAMKGLASKLLDKIIYNSCFDECEYKYCSAVCADSHGQEHDAPAPEEHDAPVPDKWDDSWDRGKYVFAFTKPPIKRFRKDIPPTNLQLGAIAKLMLTI